MSSWSGLMKPGSTPILTQLMSVGTLVWAVTAVLLGAALFRAWLSKRPIKGNPINWPAVGMLPGIFPNLPIMYDWMTSVLVNNGGSFSFYGPWLSNMNYFVTADPRNIEHALRTHFHNFPKGKDFTDIFRDILGDGIFNADDHLWVLQRKPTSVQFHSPAYKQYTDSLVFEMVEKKLIPTLQHFCDRKVQVDFQDLMLRCTFDTICTVIFGVDTGCLTPELPVVPFAEAFDIAVDCTAFRFFLPPRWWQALRWLRLGKERSMPHAIKTLRGIVDQMFTSKRKEIEQGLCGNKLDLMTCFLSMNSSQVLDDKLLKDVTFNYLLAGRETTAQALSWFFWLLAKNPDVEEKAAEEAQRVIEGAATKEGGKPILTRMVLNHMHYLHAALTEALRLYPSVPINVKETAKDDVLPDGTRLRKGDKFMYVIYAMGRMESIWGPDYSLFRPERWLHPQDGTFTEANVSPFHYLAFNGGPRTCLGKDMAYVMMKAVASAILFHFRVVLVPGHEVAPKLSIVLYMRDGLLVTLEPRKKP